MKEQTVIVHNESGLHARPAHDFIAIAKRYRSKVVIRRGDAEFNGKSIINLLCAEIRKNTEIVIACDGPDEAEALGALVSAVEGGLGEG